MKLLQKIVSVEVPEFPIVRLTYSDGFEATLDFGPKIARGHAMVPLGDPELFKTAHIGSKGSALAWIGPDGDEIDFCADALRMEAEQRGAASAAE